MQNHPTGHQAALQTLRGLAAIIVLWHHGLRLVDGADLAGWISGQILNAHAAVVVFFVLSGYVLTLSMLRTPASFNAVLQFCTKRVFRIYPAMFLGVMMGMVYLLTLADGPRTHFSPWAASLYPSSSAQPGTIIGSYAGLYTDLLPPLWTIKIELLASVAVVPATVWALQRRRGYVLPLVMLLWMTGLSFLFPESAKALYLYQFLIGALCARYQTVLCQWLPQKTWALVLALLVLAFFRPSFAWSYHAPLPNLIESLAGAWLILGLAGGNAPRWMHHPRLVYLGDISYGLYLFHLPIAMALVNLAAPVLAQWGWLPDAIAFSTTLTTGLLTMLVAMPIYHRVEQPFMAWGRVVSQRLASKRPWASPA